MFLSSLVVTAFALAANGRGFPCQDNAISVDGLSTMPAESPTVQDSSAAISVDGISMMPLESPGTYLDGATTLLAATPTPVALTFTATYLHANSTRYEVETVTLFPAQTESASDSVTPSSSAISLTSSSRNCSGAIAGGAVGAVVFAVVAAFALLHFRNKRSPRHWRNRTRVFRWQSLDSKPVISTSNAQTGYTGAFSSVMPDHKSPIASPVAAKFASTDPPVSTPQGELSVGHRRNQSSFGSFVGVSRRPDEIIEMIDHLSAPRLPHVFTPAPKASV